MAALIIEDQVAPKRCGHMDGKRVIPVSDMIAKLKSALDARVDADLMIVARTDARAIEGLEAAVERAQLYRAVGADMIFVEAPLSTDEMAYICSDIAAPCLANNVEGGKTPVLKGNIITSSSSVIWADRPPKNLEVLNFRMPRMYGS